MHKTTLRISKSYKTMQLNASGVTEHNSGIIKQIINKQTLNKYLFFFPFIVNKCTFNQVKYLIHEIHLLRTNLRHTRYSSCLI